MNRTRIFSNSGPVGRWTYALVAIVLLDSIIDVVRSWAPHDRAYLILNLVFFIFSVLAWPLLTIGRLRELRLSQLWILPILVPFAMAAVAVFEGWPVWFRVSMGVAFVVQLPLVLLSRRTDLTTTEIESSDGPPA
jgi:uncharacterized membrane protein YhaH (DUF805 family)